MGPKLVNPWHIFSLIWWQSHDAPPKKHNTVYKTPISTYKIATPSWRIHIVWHLAFGVMLHWESLCEWTMLWILYEEGQGVLNSHDWVKTEAHWRVKGEWSILWAMHCERRSEASCQHLVTSALWAAVWEFVSNYQHLSFSWTSIFQVCLSTEFCCMIFCSVVSLLHGFTILIAYEVY